MDTTVTIPALPMVDLEIRVELILTDRPQRATWWEPGHGGAVELGTIERQVRRNSSPGGSQRDYEPFPNDAVGNALEQAVRDVLEGDASFMQDALTEALEDAAAEREEAMERRWEVKRDDALMEEMR